jgi:hypothetical protein
MDEQALRGAEDVAGGVEGNGAVSGQLLAMFERQHVLQAFSRHPGLHESRRAAGAENLAMRRDVIRVRMRHKRPFLWKMRIEPPLDLREPDPRVEFNLPWHVLL